LDAVIQTRKKQPSAVIPILRRIFLIAVPRSADEGATAFDRHIAASLSADKNSPVMISTCFDVMKKMCA
jgi:hypothetical protein